MTKYNNLAVRLKTAIFLLLGLLVIYCFALLSGFSREVFSICGLILVLGAAYEVAQIVSRSVLSRAYTCFVLSCPAIWVCLFAFAIGAKALPVITSVSLLSIGLLISIALVIIGLVTFSRLELAPAERWMASVLPAWIQIGIGGGSLVGLAQVEHHAWLLFWLMSVVFWNDVAAYFVGSKLGGPLLAPTISPKKTISGAVGGLLGGVITGVVFAWLLGRWWSSWSDVILLALVLAIAAQLGDLLKSFVKRIYQIKDFGNLLPGHGGVLDRIDGVLMAGPVFLVWLFTWG